MTDDKLAQSADYKEMLPYWERVSTVMSGVEAMRAMSKVYLPRFPEEAQDSYDYRVNSSRLTDIFSDIIESLASKPFAREVGLADGAPEFFRKFVEDVDVANNHIHIFAQQVFFNGIAYAIDWIFVDYPVLTSAATLADERAADARPYFVRIPAKDVLEVRSDVSRGRESVTYVRINESYFNEQQKQIYRVREFEKKDGNPTFNVWERGADEIEWRLVDDGVLSIQDIPIVPFYTGQRRLGSWTFTQPMKRVIDLQIEHYQQETDLKLARQQTAFPMLTGAGITPPVDSKGNPVKLPIGPGAVLYAPMNEQGQHGAWNTLEPSTSSLQFLAAERDKTEQQMRELGRQPLTAGTSGITQVAAAFASQRASSAVQAWAYMLKDSLESALRFAAQWVGVDYEPTVYINTDFAIEIGDDKAPELLLNMQKDGLISRETLLREMKRRGILSEEVDEEAEALRLLSETGQVESGETPITSGMVNNA